MLKYSIIMSSLDFLKFKVVGITILFCELRKEKKNQKIHDIFFLFKAVVFWGVGT